MTAPLTGPELAAWRTATRERLLAARAAMSDEEHRSASLAVNGRFANLQPVSEARCVGFFWPVRREVSVLPTIERLLHAGKRAALPVVIGKGKPLEFRAWTLQSTMTEGVYGIPYPSSGEPVQPDLLLIALLGFDAASYRLGYGGGYYDRTLAAMAVKPLTIGVGFELGRLLSIHPQPFDIPMDRIVTESVTEERSS